MKIISKLITDFVAILGLIISHMWLKITDVKICCVDRYAIWIPEHYLKHTASEIVFPVFEKT